MSKKNILYLAVFLVSSFAMAQKRKDVLNTMKTATHFMMDEVSYQGGFVWNYLPDFSRSWGELEAKRTMVWIQPPGTPTMGHIFMDAYFATHDDYYYDASLKVAKALIKGQLPCGGWNYMFDMAGEDSLIKWYDTVGKNGWRLEEFQHYYGNATFDDAGTSQAGKLLLRIFLVKKDPAIGAALEKVIQFVLNSQYPAGGWPQRFPLMTGFSKNGLSDYSAFLTLNDAVLIENIEFLTLCYQTLKRKELKEPILKAMYCCKDLQQGQPYPGWSDQYTLDLKPAHARTYEPKAINTSTTADYVMKMMDFYKMTGDTSFLTGIPAAVSFLESQKLPDSMVVLSGKQIREAETFMAARFIDPDTGKPLFIHRKGSNVVNGKYFADQNIAETITHYSSQAFINSKEIRHQYEALKKMNADEVTKDSPFRNVWGTPPQLILSGGNRIPGFPSPEIDEVLSDINTKGYWPSTLRSRSNPYIGKGPSEGSEETKYALTKVGDLYDTSCFGVQNDVECISTSIFVMNMSRLIQFLISEK